MSRKRANGHLNIESVIDHINTLKEEAEQADLGKTESGQQISFFINRTLDKLSDKLRIDLES